MAVAGGGEGAEEIEARELMLANGADAGVINGDSTSVGNKSDDDERGDSMSGPTGGTNMRGDMGDMAALDLLEEEEGIADPPLSVYSILTFSWLSPLMAQGVRQVLGPSDLYPLPSAFSAQHLGVKLSALWAKRNPSPGQQQRGETGAGKGKGGGGGRGRGGGWAGRYWAVIMWPFRWRLTLVAVLIVAESAQRILSAFLLRQLVRFLQDAQDSETSDPAWRGYLLAVLMGLLALGFALLHHQIWNLSQIVGWNLRVASMTLINSKLLSLNGGALTRITTGHCITLMSNDVRRFDELPMFAQFLWAAPLELVVVTALIVLEVGAQPAFAGIAALLALIPLQALFGHFFAKQRRRTVEFTDARVKMTGEVLSGILAVKMFAWEAPFTSFIQRIRNKERRNIELASYIKAFNEASYFASSSMVSLVIFATYTLQGGYLQPSTVFYVISLVQLPRLWMCVFFPAGIERVAEAAVSFSRLEAFMRLSNSTNRGEGATPVPSPNEKNTSTGGGEGEEEAVGELLQQEQDPWRESAPTPPPAAAAAAAASVPATDAAAAPAAAGVAAGDGGAVGEGTEQGRGGQESVCAMVNASFGWRVGAGEREEATGTKGQGKDGSGGSGSGGELNGELNGEMNGEANGAVNGEVGAGKSTLLAGILGDAELMGGELVCRAEKIAYAAQKPFVMAGSLKDNIIFGRPFQAELYNQVLDACALRRDIANWPRGDLTEIGERGVNLSGGQKARVGLARAAYAADAALLLLDDPLSAVDPAVGRHLFEQCIRGVMSGRPRIVVTHQLQYLPSCDRVLVLDGGKPVALGPYADLASQVDFQGLLGGDEREGDEGEGGVEGLGEEDDLLAAGGAEVGDGRENGGVGEGGARLQHQCLFTVGEDGDEEDTGGDATEGLVQKEKKEEGMVSLRVYLGYAKRVGVWQSLLLVLLLAVGQTLACAGDWFLAFWSQKKDQSGPYRPIYTALVLTGVVTSFVRSGLFFRWCVRAASRIHSAMLACVLGSPLAFFHANPIGRILNRFSADQGILDDLLPFTLFNYLQTLSLAVGAIVMVALGVPWILIPMALLFLLFLRLRYVFLCTSREAKRLEAVTRSPVYAHYAATIQGLTTIRAFGAQQQSATIFHRLLNANGRAFYCWLAASRWLAFRLDTIVSAVVFLVATLAVALRTTLPPGLVALALSYTLQMSGMLQWAVRQGAEVENMFTGVERALEYTHLPQEEGLEDVSFQLQGGEKCGVVGRTGAGKSTLMLALFRLVQPSGGCILIDGVDTATISLTRLRRNVMAIPQDPVLFGSSLRFNLDPFNQHPDAALWEALDAVQLRGKAGGLQRGLEASMSEFGENFSVGQRQLVCLARAVLHRSRILLMDEATANVDMATDALIQTTIRRQFAASTVITIAHRLHTIIDADKVLVLEQGRVVQFGSPQQLAADRVGSFSRMISNTGRSSEASLRSALARDGSQREASLRDASVKEAATGDVSGREDVQRDKEAVNIDVMPSESDGLLRDRDSAGEGRDADEDDIAAGSTKEDA
ncbi:unnamed protein product [Closterium sp. NIES-65]|nr:unnamed protein product [Closterium sp. NIES-65]